MKRIDTSKWKKFRVGDLFEIVSGKGITKKEITEHGGSLPAIQSGEERFGLMGYINEEYCIKKKYAISKGECLTVARSGSSGYVGYQAKKCVVGDSAKILEPKFESNTSCLLFIRALLMENKKKYAYKDKVTTENYEKDVILLPATSSGDPDWEYIEAYMRKYEQQTNSSIKALKHLTETHNPQSIDTSNWKEFSLSELFEIKLSEGDNKANLLGDGDIPLISSGSFNNGVTKYINEGDGISKIFNENVITVDMFGKAFYQDKPFYAVSHGRVNILEPRFTNNKYIGLFIASIIDGCLYPKYDFKTMCNQSQLQKEKIYLPATSSGEPDWNLMEQYMRQVELQVKNSILALTTPTPQVQQQTNLVNYGTVNIYEK